MELLEKWRHWQRKRPLLNLVTKCETFILFPYFWQIFVSAQYSFVLGYKKIDNNFFFLVSTCLSSVSVMSPQYLLSVANSNANINAAGQRVIPSQETRSAFGRRPVPQILGLNQLKKLNYRQCTVIINTEQGCHCWNWERSCYTCIKSFVN